MKHRLFSFLFCVPFCAIYFCIGFTAFSVVGIIPFESMWFMSIFVAPSVGALIFAALFGLPEESES